MIKLCAYCGQEFETFQPHSLYCSRRCCYRVMNERSKRKELGLPELPKLTARIVSNVPPDRYDLRRLNGEKICMWCGEPVDNGNQHFCSDECLLGFYAKKFISLNERGL